MGRQPELQIQKQATGQWSLQVRRQCSVAAPQYCRPAFWTCLQSGEFELKTLPDDFWMFFLIIPNLKDHSTQPNIYSQTSTLLELEDDEDEVAEGGSNDEVASESEERILWTLKEKYD